VETALWKMESVGRLFMNVSKSTAVVWENLYPDIHEKN